MRRPLILLVLTSVLSLGAINFLSGVSPAPRPAPPSSPEPVVTPAADPVVVIDDEPPRQDPVISPPPPSPSPIPSPAVVDQTLRAGSKGPAVQQLQQRLTDLKYMVGKVDGVFSSSTRHGLIAFQKVEGLERNGVVGAATEERLRTATTPAPRFTTPADHLEVDIPRQVVFVVRGGAVSAILPTSTGSNKNFTNQGWTRRAVTPNGAFKINRKINAMRVSPLGELYKPSYFNGGIAFHGNGSVPTGPASHGCVRLPMAFATWFFENASPVGQTVYVYGGPSGENPQPTIDDAPAPLPTMTEEPLPIESAAQAAPSPAEPEASLPPDPSPEPSPSPSPDPIASPVPMPTGSFPFL